MLTRDSYWRIFRSLLQLIVGGGLAGVILQVTNDTPDRYDPYIVLLGGFIVIVAQNVLESMTGSKLIGPQVVSTKAADVAVDKAYTATPGIDPMPVIKK